MDFLTIEKEIQVEIVEKKSKFIAHLFPVESIESAENLIKDVKKKYYDARHNCTAYRVLEDNQIIDRYNDDGEPSGTAGNPMLSILQKNELVNVLVIVTRYFGGVLLGTGGLVRAYSDSLLKAIQHSHLIQKCQGIEMMVEIEYSQWDSFQYYCRKNKILLTNVEYSEWISCKIELEDDKKEKLLEDFEAKKVILKDLTEIDKKYILKSI